MTPTMESVAALPQSTVSQLTGDRRKVQTTWRLTEPVDNERGEPTWVEAHLTTYHYADRKQYATSLIQVVKTRGGYFTSERFDLLSGLTMHRVPVARHSGKALTAAHTGALNVLAAAFLREDEQVLRYFDPSTARLED